MIWIPVNGVKSIPVGDWLVTTEERDGGGREVHVAKVRENYQTVGNHFPFDMPKVIAYMELPKPFKY
ncbi:hypothetical protein AAHW26_09115 [Klebsiella quasipneumoniae subsp. similipneumoniae]|uniref:hypothetical protein n=1 Tax=Klebsiella quasipneumoniae TaxID=1463165 RepID=UPI0035A97719